MLIDADPIRLSGVSSSDAEKLAAKKIIDDIETSLSLDGWPDPIKADSGNGYHLLYRINLPAEDGGLVRNCLRALSAQYSTPEVTIDTAVYNPARICKLYGTVSRKGDSTPERPHRNARILSLPEGVENLPVEESLLRSLAESAPPDTRHAPAAKPASHRTRVNGKHSDPIKAATAYLTKVPPSISGQKGHDQLFHAASTLVDGFALSIADALPILQHWNITCQPPWSEADLERKLTEAEKSGAKSGRLLNQSSVITPPQSLAELMDLTAPSPPIINGIESDSGTIPVPINTITEAIFAATSGWPKRVGSSLFIHSPDSREVDWLERPSMFYGWLGSILRQPPTFHRSPGCHSKEEVFGELCRTAEAFQSVESMPHEPPVKGHYYTHEAITPGDGSTLNTLISRFNPESDIDRDLIVAMFATVLWGGSWGARPMFLISCDRGRGAGKSALAHAVCRFAGGHMEFFANEDARCMRERLLSSGGMRCRVALLDNIKTHRFSWAELEGLVTSSTISGRRMYQGEGTRPNNLIWIITLNGISLSKDIAQRTVVIKLRPADYSSTWQQETNSYIESNRMAIAADLVALLRSTPQDLRRHSRFGEWDSGVLAKLPDPNEAMAVISDRQTEGNVENEESGLLEEYVQEQLEGLRYDTSTQQVFIPSVLMADWFNRATGEKHSVVSVGRIIQQKVNEKDLFRVSGRRMKSARGFAWTGEEWTADQGTHFDIEERIREAKRIDRRGF